MTRAAGRSRVRCAVSCAASSARRSSATIRAPNAVRARRAAAGAAADAVSSRWSSTEPPRVDPFLFARRRSPTSRGPRRTASPRSARGSARPDVTGSCFPPLSGYITGALGDRSPCSIRCAGGVPVFVGLGIRSAQGRRCPACRSPAEAILDRRGPNDAAAGLGGMSLQGPTADAVAVVRGGRAPA